MNPSAHEGTWAVYCRIVAQLLGNAQPSEWTNTATFTLRSGRSPIVSGQVVWTAPLVIAGPLDRHPRLASDLSAGSAR